MALSTGTRLGPYEIVAPLGAGGMGEVYRARDTRLHRTVAVKVVSSAWSDTEEGRRRFEREARIVSQINHPNVCALFDVGRAGEQEFLVMELLEGETLRARLARGPLPIGDLLQLGQALASGLDAAHRQGVVHRDFKPGNAMLSKHGVKILDFGLARALMDEPAEAADTRAFDTSAAGTILGTLPYMAPEQLQGQAVDARSDVFALGAVLYEMATGRRAFDAPTQAGVIAAVIGQHPPAPSSTRNDVPRWLDRLVAQCLAKDPDQRPQTAGEVARALLLIGDAALDDARQRPPAAVWPERLAWMGLAIALAATLAMTGLRTASDATVPQPPVTFEVPLPEGGRFAEVVDLAATLATSPDGRHIVFPLTTGEVTQLWLHSFETMRARPLRGTEGARGPFWSPGSRQVAFFVPGALKRVSIESDAVDQVCPSETTVSIGTWGTDDTILFVDSTADALMRVPAAGGQPNVVMSVAGMGVTWPHSLPDGRRFLIGSPSGVRLGTLGAAELTPVLDVPTAAAYSPTGHLLYVRESALVAQRFDVASGRVEGEPRVLADGLQYFAPTGGASFSASHTGTIVYRRSGIVPRRVVWIARDGREIADAVPEAPWVFTPRISPDGMHLALTRQIATSGSTDLWVYELETGTPTRLTSDIEVDNWPVWWPDGRSLVFSRNMGGQAPHLARKALTDVGAPTPLAPPTGLQYHPDVTPDGTAVALGQGGDLWLWRVGATALEPLVRTPFAEGSPAFSPDGRWLAYDSNVSGRIEVYVRPFERSGDPVRVSTGGGSAPVWRGDGREVFFLDPDGHIMGAPVVPGPPFTARTPIRLTDGSTRVSAFDATRDGQRFAALLPPPPQDVSSLTVILNWPALLR